MKKLIIKESVVDGKMSNAELLLNVLHEKARLGYFSNTLVCFDKFIKEQSDDIIEDLAHDMGYWEGSLEKAIKRMRRLALFITNSNNFYRKPKTPSSNFLAFANDSNFSFSVQAKLFLYFVANGKNKIAVDKKVHSLTGLNYIIILRELEKIIEENNFKDYTEASNYIFFSDTKINGMIPCYLDWFNDIYDWHIEYIKQMLAEKTHRKNKVNL